MGIRLAVDARWVQDRPLGGVGRALAHVLPLIAADPRIDAITYLTAAEKPRAALGPNETALRTPFPGVAAAWLQRAAPTWLRHHKDVVFHCDWYGLPYRQPVPMTATIHDLTFEHRPEWFTAHHRITYRAQARHAARTARCLLAPSQHVRDDISRTYDVDPERIVVAPRSVGDGFRPEAEQLPFRGTLPRDYVIALSGAPRRRIDVAIAAWRSAGRPLDLVVVGPRCGDDEPGLRWLGRLDDPPWKSCLAGGRAFLYPTEDEGFGLPALEAIASGTPVVCARVGSLPEVLGDAAAWSASGEPEQFATALLTVLHDTEVATRLREQGLAQAARGATWETCANAYVEAFVCAAS